MPILYESYSTSPEVKVSAQKKPTEMKIYLWNTAKTERMEGKTVYTGTKIIVRVGVFSTAEGKWIPPTPQNVLIYRKIDAGAYERIWAGGWTAEDTFDVEYTLTKAGIHTLYAEFPGTDFYAGCSKTVRAFAR